MGRDVRHAKSVHEGPEAARLRRNRFGEAWAATVARAGLPKGTHFHDLRHYYASLLIRHGESVKVVQARLGTQAHKRPSTPTGTSGPTPTGGHGPLSMKSSALQNRLKAWARTSPSPERDLAPIPVADQAALHGLLRKLQDLGLPLLSVTQVGPDQPEVPATQT